jgi:hypothetical protein
MDEQQDLTEATEEEIEARWRQASAAMFLAVAMIGLLIAAVFAFG